MLKEILDRLNSKVLLAIHLSRLKGQFNKLLDFTIIENGEILYSDKGITSAVFRKVPKHLNDLIGKSPIIFSFENGLENEVRLLIEDLEAPHFWDSSELTKIANPFLQSYEIEDLTETFNLLPNKNLAQNSFEVFEKSLELLFARPIAFAQKLSALGMHSESEFSQLFQALLDTKVKHIGQDSIKSTLGFSQTNNVVGENSKPLISGQTGRLRPLKTSKIVEIFQPNGLFSEQFDNFESREEQASLVNDICEAFNDSRFLVAEAQTGTGKSMAYLVPSVFWTMKNSEALEKVVISTRTKNLQEQLFFKDIPTLQRIFKLPFKAVLLKGRNNYLCLTKWNAILNASNKKFTTEDKQQLLKLLVWFEETKTGDIAENQAFNSEAYKNLWGKLASESGYCNMANCKHPQKCFISRVRNEAKTANLVLVNHSLLFSDLLSENNVFGKYENLIIDEAHSFEKTAIKYFGTEMSVWAIKSLLNKIHFNEAFETGLVVSIRTQIGRSNNLKSDAKTLITRETDSLSKLVDSVKIKSMNFFSDLTKELQAEVPNYKNQKWGVKLTYKDNSPIWENVFEPYKSLRNEVAALNDALQTLGLIISDTKEETLTDKEDLLQELKSCLTESIAILENLLALVENYDPEFVYWFELPVKTNSVDTRFFSVPLDVSELLQKNIYENLQTLVFTSATLSAGDKKFEYFRKRVGLDLVLSEKVATSKYDSPFDFEKNCKLIVPTFLPPPNFQEFNSETLRMISATLKTLDKGCLILCTSYAQLNYFADGLKEEMQSQKRTLLVQGKDGNRTMLVSRFREIENSVLIGTDSFWEGVDISGTTLSIVIIAKLPFEVPDEPIVKAKMDKIANEGGNSFAEYYLPEAIVKFRQGFGRLIRSKTDKGIVIVADTRIAKKNYGRKFIADLPMEMIKTNDLEHFRQELGNFF